MSNTRRRILKMDQESLLRTVLAAIFLFSIIIAHVNAQETVVYVDPPLYTAPEVGATFSMNISIANVTNLYAYHVILWYNTTLLDAVDITLPPNHFLTPSESTNLFDMSEIEDDYNTTHGVLGVLATLTGDENSKNGSGTLATITFNSSNPDGPSPLKLYYPGFQYPVKLSDPDSNPIPCTAVDGSTEVLPEFSTVLLVLSIIVTTSVVIVLIGRNSPFHPNQIRKSNQNYRFAMLFKYHSTKQTDNTTP